MVNAPQFVLNDKIIDVTVPLTLPLLDVVRYHQGLMGTKIGCREGDCGACVVMIGTIHSDQIEYKTITSCLTPVANIIGMHVVTIEGLNLNDGLNKVQQALVEHGGTQCGACTPGFVVSILNGVYDRIQGKSPQLISSIDGNICRCTGYKSIEKAIIALESDLNEIKPAGDILGQLVNFRFLPKYFKTVKQLLMQVPKMNFQEYNSKMRIISGGTDLYVQIPDKVLDEQIMILNQLHTDIRENDDKIIIGGSCTGSQIMSSAILRQVLPDIESHFKLFASTPIRNIATIGGNIVNGSPIADMVVYFLPFEPILTLRNLTTNGVREVALVDLYIKYKTLDKTSDEIIDSVNLFKPQSEFKFNFEKISKRNILDIASVNSAFYIEVNADGVIQKLKISAGGVYEIPKLLNSSQIMVNKRVDEESILELLQEIDKEIQPISDVRGSEHYKRRLLRNLVIAHFLECFADELNFEELIV